MVAAQESQSPTPLRELVVAVSFYVVCYLLLQVGVHYGGKFYEFVPWNGVVTWEIATWGYWYIAAENETHMVWDTV